MTRMFSTALTLLLTFGASFARGAELPPIAKAVVKIVAKAPPGERDLVSSGLRMRFEKIDPGHPPVAYFVLTAAHALHPSPLAGAITVSDESSPEGVACELVNADFRLDVAILECPPPTDPSRAFDFLGEGSDSLRFSEPPLGHHATDIDGWLLGFPAQSKTLYTEFKNANDRAVTLVNDADDRIHPGLKDHLEVSGVRPDAGLSGGVFVSTRRYMFHSFTRDEADAELIPLESSKAAIPLGLISKRLGQDKVGLIPMRKVLAVFLGSVRFGAWPGPRKVSPFAGEQVRQDGQLRSAHPLNVEVGDLTFLMQVEELGGEARRVIRIEPSTTFDFTRMDNDVYPQPGSFYAPGSYYFGTEYLYGQRTVLHAARQRPGCSYSLIASLDSAERRFQPFEHYESALEPFLARRGSIFGREFNFPPTLLRIACTDDEQILAKIEALVAQYRALRRQTAVPIGCDITGAERFLASVTELLRRRLSALPPMGVFADWKAEQSRHAWRCQEEPPSNAVAVEIDREIRKIFRLVRER